MIIRIAGETRRGPIVDLRGWDVDADGVVAAIRGRPSPYAAATPPAGEVHERAGYVHPDLGLRTKTALAVAARSRGLTAPQDDQLCRVREELADVECVEAQQSAQAAPDGDDVTQVRERVAELRGRVRTLEECDRDPAEARADLRAAIQRLSELETRQVASVQTRERARQPRDRRERRLRLEDRVANLEREARAHLVDAVEGEFARAVAALDGSTDPFEADPATAALAVLRVAEVHAPVVLAVDRFPDPAVALRWLGAPIVRI